MTRLDYPDTPNQKRQLENICEIGGYFRHSQNVLTARENESERFDEDSTGVTPLERDGEGDVGRA